MKFEFNFEKKHLVILLVGVALIVALGVGIAYVNPISGVGHDYQDIGGLPNPADICIGKLAGTCGGAPTCAYSGCTTPPVFNPAITNKYFAEPTGVATFQDKDMGSPSFCVLTQVRHSPWSTYKDFACVVTEGSAAGTLSPSSSTSSAPGHWNLRAWREDTSIAIQCSAYCFD